MSTNLEKCKYHGARSPEMREKSKKCRECKENDQELYRSCVIETNEILKTSILLDEEGNTMTVTNENTEGIQDQPKPEREQEKPKPEKKTVKSTGGVLTVAKDMLVEGKPDGEILAKLIEIYTNDGKSPKQAKHNAQSCLFNAKKRAQKQSNG